MGVESGSYHFILYLPCFGASFPRAGEQGPLFYGERRETSGCATDENMIRTWVFVYEGEICWYFGSNRYPKYKSHML